MKECMQKIRNIEKSMSLEPDPIKRVQQNQELRNLLKRMEQMMIDERLSA